MENKKGFTLIELLAVVVIIAIIALISVPIISTILGNTRKNAFKKTVDNITRTIELYLLDEYDGKFKNQKVFILDDGITEKDEDIIVNNLKFDGTVTGEGKIIVNSRNQYYIYYSTNEYCAYKDFMDKEIIINKGLCDEISPAIVLIPDKEEYLIQKGNEFSIPLAILIVPSQITNTGIVSNEIKTEIYLGQNKVDKIDTNAEYGTEYKVVYLSEYNDKPVKREITVRIADVTEPNVTVTDLLTNTKGVKVDILASDTESNIQNVTFMILKDNVVIKTFTPNKIPSISNEYSALFDDLESDTNYKVLVKVENGSGLISEESREFVTQYIDRPTINISPEGYSQTKKVIIDFPENTKNLIYNYGIGTNNFEAISGNQILTDIEENNIITANITDGENEVSSSSYNVENIDRTPPESLTLIIIGSTKSSVVLEAAGVDSQSGIYGYSFSKDNGQHWTNIQTNPRYTFTNLAENDSYIFTVKAYNNTYKYKDIVGFNEELGTKILENSLEYNVNGCLTPTFTLNPDNQTWAQGKYVIINYDEEEECTHTYSIDGGQTWNLYTEPIPVTVNGLNIIAMNANSNNSNDFVISQQIVNNIDRTNPDNLTTNYTKNSDTSMTITGTARDDQSGIYYLRYSSNGTSWTNGTTLSNNPATNVSDSKTYNNLSSDTSYTFKIRAYNRSYFNTPTALRDETLAYIEKSVTTYTVPSSSGSSGGSSGGSGSEYCIKCSQCQANLNAAEASAWSVYQNCQANTPSCHCADYYHAARDSAFDAYNGCANNCCN